MMFPSVFLHHFSGDNLDHSCILLSINQSVRVLCCSRPKALMRAFEIYHKVLIYIYIYEYILESLRRLFYNGVPPHAYRPGRSAAKYDKLGGFFFSFFPFTHERNIIFATRVPEIQNEITPLYWHVRDGHAAAKRSV